MRTTLIVLAVLFVLSVGRRLFIFAIAHLLGRAIGRKALSKQPDTIHLTRASSLAWKNAEAAGALANPLLKKGFRDAGTYTVPEMPGLTLRLLTNPSDSMLAVIYEHPRAGHWIDLATRYRDGTSANFTTTPETGLDPRPGHPSVHAPGTDPLALYQRALAERARGAMTTIAPEDAAQNFETSYAESMTWRKSRGVSAVEVAKVAQRRAA